MRISRPFDEDEEKVRRKSKLKSGEVDLDSDILVNNVYTMNCHSNNLKQIRNK